MANCCLVGVPIIILGLLLALQYLIESTFLSKSWTRCPYCGPSDSFAEYYCAGKASCVCAISSAREGKGVVFCAAAVR